MLSEQKQRTKKVTYRFECKDYCSSWYDIPAPLTFDKVWGYIRMEGWNGKKHNYRLIPLDSGDFEVQSDLSCGDPCQWRTCQVLKREEKDHAE